MEINDPKLKQEQTGSSLKKGKAEVVKTRTTTPAETQKIIDREATQEVDVKFGHLNENAGPGVRNSS